MDFFKILELIGGLALFLFGMHIMGSYLQKRAGSKLKVILQNMTSNTFKGFLLGVGTTVVMQSSSATTVMVVGFVNSGLMTLRQSYGVIVGANLGATITPWLLSLSGISGGGFILQLFKPSSFTPMLALVGILLLMFQKSNKRKDIGMILLGFAVLMYGMEIMSGSVSGLRDNEAFKSILTLFTNPILGILIGVAFTAIIQSSSASIGILQALTVTKGITYAAAIPIVMGQNIGTCVSAMISSIGASKNARRTAIVHLSFNVIATLIFLPIYYFGAMALNLSIIDQPASVFGVAIVNTGFKTLALVLMPFGAQFEKLSYFFVKEKKGEAEKTELLDERLIATPSVAIATCRNVTLAMAELSISSMYDAIEMIKTYDQKTADKIREDEGKVDMYEDKIGSYLVKLSMQTMTKHDSTEATKLLHLIGDFERISDHALKICESAEEMHEKKMDFSGEAKRELTVLTGAIHEILGTTLKTFENNDLDAAVMVEPLEQVVDDIKDKLKNRHVARLQKQECTIEQGFVLTDILTDFARVSDHCSNIAACVLEMAHQNMGVHEYLNEVKGGNMKEFNDYYDYYTFKYSLD